jgi:threonine/homoserine/homoserine lactone efflux protein
MPSLDTLAVFSAAVVLFALIPGPAVLYVVTRSVSQGRGAGVVSALGVAAGNLVHVAAATLGLSAVVASSAAVFATVKYLGAAYLVYLGVKTLRARDEPEARFQAVRAEPLRRVLLHGVVVAVLNPKTALFFLAFLPQFVHHDSGPVPAQILVLGLLLVAITGLSDSTYALVSGTAGGWLRGRFRRAQRLVVGGTYVTLGVVAALAGGRPEGGVAAGNR